jgi:hypothetical protein
MVFTRALLVAAAVGACGLVSANGQGLAPAPGARQHVTVVAGASAPSVAPGGTVSLWLDVAPKTGVHVYAQGAKEFQPAKLVISPNPQITLGKPVYPPSVPLAVIGIAAPVPVYSKTFRVVQPIVVAKTVAHGGAVILSGTLNYEACDDRECYPPATLPAYWRIRVN